jgi:hypothetical protein
MREESVETCSAPRSAELTGAPQFWNCELIEFGLTVDYLVIRKCAKMAVGVLCSAVCAVLLSGCAAEPHQNYVWLPGQASEYIARFATFSDDELIRSAEEARRAAAPDRAFVFFATAVRMNQATDSEQEARYWMQMAGRTPVIIREAYTSPQLNGALARRYRSRQVPGLPEAICVLDQRACNLLGLSGVVGTDWKQVYDSER